MEDCHEKLRPLLSEKKIDFINNIYKGGTKIEADLFQLTRVFINLLSNAIENTNEGNYIKVGAKFEDQNVYITIEDNGNGIAPEDLKVIFDRYYSGKVSSESWAPVSDSVYAKIWFPCMAEKLP